MITFPKYLLISKYSIPMLLFLWIFPPYSQWKVIKTMVFPWFPNAFVRTMEVKPGLVEAGHWRPPFGHFCDLKTAGNS